MFLVLLQGLLVPIALIAVAFVLAPNVTDLQDDDSKGFSYWAPYLLVIPAFLDIGFVALLIARERGPGGSLEFQLFPCIELPSNRANS